MFHFVCDLDSLAPNLPKTMEVDDRFVVVTLIEGEADNYYFNARSTDTRDENAK